MCDMAIEVLMTAVSSAAMRSENGLVMWRLNRRNDQITQVTPISALAKPTGCTSMSASQAPLWPVILCAVSGFVLAVFQDGSV